MIKNKQHGTKNIKGTSDESISFFDGRKLVVNEKAILSKLVRYWITRLRPENVDYSQSIPKPLLLLLLLLRRW